MYRETVIDPFGAPEHWVDVVAFRDTLAPGIVRLAFASHERGELIVRTKILMPVTALLVEQKRTQTFIRQPTDASHAIPVLM